MNKKFVYQVGNNRKVILWGTANQISRLTYFRFGKFYPENRAFYRIVWKNTVAPERPQMAIYRVIKNDCRGFNNLSYTIYLRQEYMYFLFNRTTLQVFFTYLTGALYVHPLWFYKHQHDNRVRSTQNAFSLPFAAILVNCAPSREMQNYCTPHIIKENFENFLIRRCNYILLSQAHCVWQVVKTPTIIFNNPVYIFGATTPQWARASSFTRFLDHTQRRTTLGRTPLDEWSARRRDSYLTSRNTHNRQTSMFPVGFEPIISTGERPQTHALDRAATGTGIAI